jgi:hypothetical protein
LPLSPNFLDRLLDTDRIDWVALLLTMPDLPPAWSNALEKRDAGGSHGSFEFQRALAMVNRTYVLCATVVRAGPALFSALSAVGHPAA